MNNVLKVFLGISLLLYVSTSILVISGITFVYVGEVPANPITAKEILNSPTLTTVISSTYHLALLIGTLGGISFKILYDLVKEKMEKNKEE